MTKTNDQDFEDFRTLDEVFNDPDFWAVMEGTYQPHYTEQDNIPADISDDGRGDAHGNIY